MLGSAGVRIVSLNCSLFVVTYFAAGGAVRCVVFLAGGGSCAGLWCMYGYQWLSGTRKNLGSPRRCCLEAFLSVSSWWEISTQTSSHPISSQRRCLLCFGLTLCRPLCLGDDCPLHFRTSCKFSLAGGRHNMMRFRFGFPLGVCCCLLQSYQGRCFFPPFCRQFWFVPKSGARGCQSCLLLSGGISLANANSMGLEGRGPLECMLLHLCLGCPENLLPLIFTMCWKCAAIDPFSARQWNTTCAPHPNRSAFDVTLPSHSAEIS